MLLHLSGVFHLASPPDTPPPLGPPHISTLAVNTHACLQVLGAAYPWIARRLLTDSNPELQETLRVLLYKVLLNLPPSPPTFPLHLLPHSLF